MKSIPEAVLGFFVSPRNVYGVVKSFDQSAPLVKLADNSPSLQRCQERTSPCVVSCHVLEPVLVTSPPSIPVMLRRVIPSRVMSCDELVVCRMSCCSSSLVPEVVFCLRHAFAVHSASCVRLVSGVFRLLSFIHMVLQGLTSLKSRT